MPATASAPASSTPDYSNGTLVVRLLKLTWQYKYLCLQVLLLQLMLLTLGLMGLNLTGVGIDYVRHAVDQTPAADWPVWLPSPGEQGSVMHGLFILAGAILVLALLRSVFNYAYSVGIGLLTQHRLVVICAPLSMTSSNACLSAFSMKTPAGRSLTGAPAMHKTSAPSSIRLSSRFSSCSFR